MQMDKPVLTSSSSDVGGVEKTKEDGTSPGFKEVID